MFEVTTLGQPFEVIKTQMASQRSDPMAVALKKVWARGGVFGCEFLELFILLLTIPYTDLYCFVVYQGLIPWAWLEASTKGAVLLFTAAEIEGATVNMGISPAVGGLLGGMGGGIAQAYATMGSYHSLFLVREPAS